MFYLNLLNKIFGNSKGVKRNELYEYQKEGSSIDKNSVEQSALGDNFEQEAFEGWANHDAKDLMQRMDNRFKRKNHGQSRKILLGTGLISVLAIIVFLFANSQFEPVENAQSIAENTIEEKPVAETPKAGIPSKKNIEEKSAIEQKIETLEPKDLASSIDRTEIVELRKTESKTPQKDKIEQNEILIEPLEAKEIVSENTLSKKLNYRLKKEIYLYDLKLVDYRPYREKKIKEQKAILLQGTPADAESKESDKQQDLFKEVDVPYIEYLEKSMYYFSKGMYKKALVRFSKILESYPNDVNANFYGALCYYNLNDRTEALTHFEKSYSVDYGNFKEEAEWLSYLTYVDMNKTKKAQELLKNIASQGGFYSERANELLQ